MKTVEFKMELIKEMGVLIDKLTLVDLPCMELSQTLFDLNQGNYDEYLDMILEQKGFKNE